MSPETIALITGGNRGIGLAIAKQLGAKGIHVILACRDTQRAHEALLELQNADISASSISLDVNNADQRSQAVDTLLKRYGRLDILVNNAGVALDKWVTTQQLQLDVMRQTMETNLYAALHLSQLVLPTMKAQGYGRIVNLSSELASLSESEMGSSAAYRVSKTALNMVTRLLALELKDQPNILINAAAPGWVKTELGGEEAPLTPEEGALTPVWLATLPEGGPSGGFFREQAPYPW